MERHAVGRILKKDVGMPINACARNALLVHQRKLKKGIPLWKETVQ